MAELIRPQQPRPMSSLSRRMAQPLEQMRSRLQPAARYLRSRAGEGKASAASSWNAVWRVRGETARRQAEASHTPWFRMVRGWSPGMIPPLLGGVLLLAVALLAARHPGGPRPLIAPSALLPLFVFYLIGGLVWGYMLHRAPDVVWWFGTLGAGIAAYLLVTAGIVGGWNGTALMGLLLVVVATWYGRRHTRSIPNGVAQMTTSAGGYGRVLLPGVSVLLPGERMGEAVATGERQYETPLQQVEVHDEQGAMYVAQASASVAYRVKLARAQQFASHVAHWEEDTHQAIEEALREGLLAWGEALVREGGGEAPDGLLTRAMLARLREWSETRGVRIEWIKAHDMWITPASETIPADDWLVGSDDPDKTTPASYAPLGAGGYEGGMFARTQALPPIGTIDRGRRTPPASPPPREALTTEALTDAFEEVRKEHILDPATIREVANAFLTAAADAELSASFPFDALGAARILLDRAKQLERAASTRTRSNSDFLR